MTNSSKNIFEQGLLRYLSCDQLNLIQQKKIGLGGAGGLGSNIAIALARSGFQHFQIIDQDIIDPSNLNRQQYYLAEVGESKVRVLQARLLAINPNIDVQIFAARWTNETGHLYFNNCDFIIEAFDIALWKHQFVDYYHDKTAYLISGVGMAGLIEKKPMSVKKVGNIFFVGDLSTDSALGHPPMAPRVMACAAMMAEIVLDLTLKIPRND